LQANEDVKTGVGVRVGVTVRVAVAVWVGVAAVDVAVGVGVTVRNGVVVAVGVVVCAPTDEAQISARLRPTRDCHRLHFISMPLPHTRSSIR